MQSADRLVSAKLRDDGSGCGRDYSTEYTYNLDSAPLTIKRKGAVGWHEFDVVDDLTIHYAHGRPVRVDDSAPEVLYESSMDFTDLADEEIEMDYDRCGRLTMDLNRGITRIAYNAIGMPMAAFKDGKKILSMEYSADGTLLSRTEYPLQITPERPDPFPFPGLSDDAAGADAAAIDFVRPELGWYRPVTYRRIGTQSWINTRLNRVESEYGYILGDTLSAYYRDFQGNICAVVRNNQPIQATSYYPYGLPMAESSKSDANRLKYSGKELVTHRGYDAYDFGPRNHLPTLCLFDNPDLLRDANPGISAYTYCSANPINRIDNNGMWDVKVSASPDRKNHPYAIFTVYNRHQEIVYQTLVMVRGSNKNVVPRNTKNSDTPQGIYNINGWEKTGDENHPIASFGPDYFLRTNYIKGEGGSRNGMHVHGGNKQSDEKLTSTNGCMRMHNDDILDFKKITDELAANDSEDKPGQLIVTDNLNHEIKYSDRSKYKINSRLMNNIMRIVLDEVTITAPSPEKSPTLMPLVKIIIKPHELMIEGQQEE